jgi:signal transduction histidine kinase
VGQAAVELPWLCPNTESLIALADAPASLVKLSAADPGLAVFLLRFAQAAPEPDVFGFAPGTILSAFLPDTAAAYLAATSAGVLPAESFVMSRVRTLVERAATLASRIAETTRLAPAATAANVARLAPLGWYAVASVDHFAAADPLGDPEFRGRPAEIQIAVWGLDHCAITRRLAARWRMPNWMATSVGCLTLPFGVASHLVSHKDLFAIVQLATLEAETHGVSLGLTHGANRDEVLAHLRLDDRVLRDLASHFPEPQPPPESSLNPNPHRVPLIRNLLRMAAESRRRNGPALVARLEEQIDHLHRVALELGDEAGERLRCAKLAGLAELAAGAGHEINNPLAIIAGNAQRLLRTEPDATRGESLQAIIRQSHRIAGILRDLMQYARPPRPDPSPFAVTELLQGVREDLAVLATERRVQLEVDPIPAGVWIDADPKQLRNALGAIVRNAIEAASLMKEDELLPLVTGAHSGTRWARVSCEAGAADADVTIVVEDSGPGLTPEVAEHAFDPFYCGRSAGRGRGLGLSTAWQLVRQNGGEVHFVPNPEGPTRFVLTLRRAIAHEMLTLRSA